MGQFDNPQQGSSRELVLAHNEQVFLQDDSKGLVATLVGAHNKQLAPTERLVVLNEKTGRFERVSDISSAVKIFPFAGEGWYIVLQNPAHDDNTAHPTTGSSYLPQIDWGRKINIPGPATFALWPGQIAKVLEGHHLRSNQYLIVRVYNEDQARANWGKSVIRRVETKPAETKQVGDPAAPKEGGESEESVATMLSAPPDLAMGRLYIVKGTDVSFYIPPTGVEVVPESENVYIRDAVTLETLYYAILLAESGDKRYERGEQVVFPTATETFIEVDGQRKFRAIELNPDMGIHIKVIKSYEEGGKTIAAGTELFITGKETTIYFPRPEHAIIRYGDKERYYGVALPAGDSRYVLDKTTGKVKPELGPQIFLPDPRTQVIVKRPISAKNVDLWFPGSDGAQEFNAKLRELTEVGRDMVEEETFRAALRSTRGATSKSLVADQMQRGTTYTPPRTITIDNKFEGAVQISPWSGYAVQVNSKTGGRRVVQSPETAILEFDETLEVLELSTGTPKTDKEPLLRTVYLNVRNNKVSDKVDAETQDLVPVQLTLSYRVNFEGDPHKWFSVSNYIKLLTEHLRSVIRGVVKQYSIQKFYDEATPILRDAILGPHPEAGDRPGKTFRENGMRVYDVEVLDVVIDDREIATVIEQARRKVVETTIRLGQQERELEFTRRLEVIKQETAVVQAETALKQADLASETALQSISLELYRVTENLKLGLEKIGSEAAQQNQRAQLELNGARADGQVADERLKAEKARANQRLEIDTREQALSVELINVEAAAFVSRIQALGPSFAAALQKFGDHRFAADLAEALAPLAIAEQNGLSHVMDRLFGENSAVSKMLATALSPDVDQK